MTKEAHFLKCILTDDGWWDELFYSIKKRTDANMVKTDRLGIRLLRESDFDEIYKIMSSYRKS